MLSSRSFLQWNVLFPFWDDNSVALTCLKKCIWIEFEQSSSGAPGFTWLAVIGNISLGLKIF